MTLSPTYNDSTLLHPVALGSLLIVAFSCIHTEELLVRQDPLLLFFVAPAIGPRFLVTLNENLEILPLQVRVGTAIDVVGQAGRPRAITGFQTLDTPVALAAGQRAEFVDDTYEPLSPILEGFVIMRKRVKKED
jgi:26S proteasome regulatory subunit N1